MRTIAYIIQHTISWMGIGGKGRSRCYQRIPSTLGIQAQYHFPTSLFLNSRSGLHNTITKNGRGTRLLPEGSESSQSKKTTPRRIFTSNFSKMLGIILLNRTTRASQLNVNQVSHMCCQREKLLRSSQRAVDLRFRSISSGSLSSSCFCEVFRSSKVVVQMHLGSDLQSLSKASLAGVSIKVD